MLLDSLIGSPIIESADDTSVLETMSDDDLSCLLAITLEDTLSPEELDRFVAEMANCPDTTYVEERTIVKLDKAAKKTRNYKMAILQCAKDGDDPNYKKICTLWKTERYLMRMMEKKWKTKAKARMRTMGSKAKESKASPIKDTLHRLTRAQRDTEKSKTVSRDNKLESKSNMVMKKIEAKIK